MGGHRISEILLQYCVVNATKANVYKCYGNPQKRATSSFAGGCAHWVLIAKGDSPPDKGA